MTELINIARISRKKNIEQVRYNLRRDILLHVISNKYRATERLIDIQIGRKGINEKIK